ncbi:glycosyltransferase family 2 protein [Vibrio campbellii]|uniref:glycosyltransferase family 2 protein n=1 Tax=Vibrio campbellii TaxID=680 RepID=UPI00210BA8A8|nr:glycosyltransferase family A protein [Vibrio campbellii]UTZ40107.1 glycosyltransferase family 2 protein [Vibrio campbellii]
MNSSPLVSIITPSYNCADTLLETADSVFKQTHANWEWLITDDCSDSKTKLLLEKLKRSDPRISVQSNTQNRGAAVTRNSSLKRAQGDFIAFLDSDDLWLPEKLSQQITFMGESIDFSFTAYEVVDHKNNSLNQVVDGNQIRAFGYEDMLRKQATLGCSTVMLRRTAFSDLQMPLLRTGQDYAFWLKLLRSGETRAHVLSTPLTRYRIMPNSISRNKIKKAKRQWQIYREVENLHFIKSVECFCYYAVRAVFRR